VHSFEHYWPETLERELARGACVLVTLIEIRGSAPRSAGARMLVGGDCQYGSIGGGNLEFEAITTARELLHEATGRTQALAPYGLGPALNQCCGGAVTLLFEVFRQAGCDWLQGLQAPECRAGDATLITAVDRDTVSKWLLPGGGNKEDMDAALLAAASAWRESEKRLPELIENDGERFLLESPRDQRLQMLLFGAGHVARAFASLAHLLPLRLRWIDSREREFPSWAEEVARVSVSPNPVGEVASGEAGCLYLVMTHSHELDEDICHAVLERGDAAWLGLIGSESKRRRFVHRLAKRGLSEPQLERLVCPVGSAGIDGKRPATIALSIATQLLREQVPDAWR